MQAAGGYLAEMDKFLGDKEKMLKALDQMLQFEEDMKDHFNHAIRLTLEAYQVGPKVQDGPVVRPKDPAGRGQWSAGLVAIWKPELLYDTKSFRRVSGMDGQNHFLGGEINLTETGAGTSPDGKVVILRQIFENASRAGNPGLLGYLLHHESQHFTDLVTRGRDDYDQGELRAYTQSLKMADVFELSEDDKTFFRNRKKEHRQKIEGGRRGSLFPTPEQEKLNEMKYDKIQTELEQFRKMSERLRKQVDEERAQRRQYEDGMQREMGRVREGSRRDDEFRRGQEEASRRLRENIERGEAERRAREEQGRREAFDEYAFQMALEKIRKMAWALCQNPETYQDFSEAINWANHYANTYESFRARLRPSGGVPSTPIDGCIQELLYRRIPEMPEPGRPWKMDIEWFRKGARELSPNRPPPERDYDPKPDRGREHDPIGIPGRVPSPPNFDGG